MKCTAVIQARMASTRLPGKVLMDLSGRPMLAQQLRRVRECMRIEGIVVATTDRPVDDPIVDLCIREGVHYFRGSETDVLSRFAGAAQMAKADVIVRMTADCPLIDPQVTDRLIDELVSGDTVCDYASNVIQRTYPRGLDVEAFTLETLMRVNRLAASPMAREHVTLFIYSDRPDLFRCCSIADDTDNSDLRWTVDTMDDLRLMRILFERLNLGEISVPYREIVSYVREHPELTEINKDIHTWTPSKKLP
jgi:spore coat polysaccharide biosynthesis protein SpsF